MEQAVPLPVGSLHELGALDMLALGKDFSTASSCETELTRTGSYNHRLIFVSCMQGISSLGKSESPHNKQPILQPIPKVE